MLNLKFAEWDALLIVLSCYGDTKSSAYNGLIVLLYITAFVLSGQFQ